MTNSILLYSRNDCPLCDHVEEILQKMGCKYEFIDIDSDPQLMKIYHVKIPVLKKSSKQIQWPFTDEEVQDFVST